MSDSYEPRHAGGASEGDVTPVEYQKPVSMMLSNQTYDKLKWVAQYLLPALGTLYGGVGYIWGLPEVDKVVATLLAVDFFLGTILGISTKTYEKSGAAYDGSANIVERGDYTAMELDLNAHPADLAGQKQVVLKVNTE